MNIRIKNSPWAMVSGGTNGGQGIECSVCDGELRVGNDGLVLLSIACICGREVADDIMGDYPNRDDARNAAIKFMIYTLKLLRLYP